VYLKSLKLYNFRNLTDQNIPLSPIINLVYGKNGQGKTNLVEAISFVSSGKSFRTQALKDLVGWGKESASVFAIVGQSDAEFEMGVSIENGSRRVFVNAEELKTLTKYVGRLICVAFSPSDLELVKGAPIERRRFIDRHLVDINPNLMSHFLSYSKALKNKNQLLMTQSAAPKMIEPWNILLSQAGFEIYQARSEFLSHLQDQVNSIHAQFAKADGEIGFVLKNNYFEAANSPSAENLFQALNQNFARELRQKTSVIGPHRDDLLISFNGHNSRAYASQGQARSIVLSMKLGVIETIEKRRGESPVVLLDDVDSELDSGRSRQFFEMVMKNRRQLFITGTDSRLSSVCEAEPFQLMQLEDGEVKIVKKT